MKDPFNIDSLIKNILIHEDLLPFQTPFRITNFSMNNWKTILGYTISHNPKPEGRTNFIFLTNQEDVFKSVKQQFLNYNYNPDKYGIGPDPTIEQAIRLFDQTGSDGKIKFLKEKIQDFDETKPLEDLIC